jgi:hypothetical protein
MINFGVKPPVERLFNRKQKSSSIFSKFAGLSHR